MWPGFSITFLFGFHYHPLWLYTFPRMFKIKEGNDNKQNQVCRFKVFSLNVHYPKTLSIWNKKKGLNGGWQWKIWYAKKSQREAFQLFSQQSCCLLTDQMRHRHWQFGQTACVVYTMKTHFLTLIICPLPWQREARVMIILLFLGNCFQCASSWTLKGLPRFLIWRTEV